MKSIILLFALASSAWSQQGFFNIHEVALTTATIRTVNITTGTAGVIDAVDAALQTSSGTLVGYFAIEIFNPAANTDTVVASFDTLISTALSSQYYGREIAPGTGLYLAVPRYRTLYVATKSAAVATRVTVSQFK